MALKNRRRSGGRKDRIAMRTAEVKQYTPSAPGQIGGQYKPLNEKELKDILETAFRILEDIGFADVPDVVMKKALQKGCRKNELGRLSFPRSFVEDIVAGACKKFTLYGRNSDHNIEVGGEKVFYGTGGAAV